MNTEIICILDRSGSMGPLVTAELNGYNRFIAEQCAVPGDARLSTVIFDTEIMRVRKAVPIKEALPLTPAEYFARGGTSLHDAIGMTLTREAERIAQEKWADLVIVFISTDGQETSSREYDAKRVKELVQHCEQHGWKFIYTAANVDAFGTGAGLGIPVAHTMSYSGDIIGTHAKYGFASASTTAIRSGQPAPVVNVIVKS